MLHITTFIFYTFAMVGILFLGFVVYKKFLISPVQHNKGMIKILDRVLVAPKKFLLVVKIQSEIFLLALDSERTTFLAKLDNKTSEVINKKDDVSELFNDNSAIKSIQKNNFKKKQNYINNQTQSQHDFLELFSQNDEELNNSKKINRKNKIRKLLEELSQKDGEEI